MGHGYRMLGFVVIMILYAVIGLMAAAGTISITWKLLAPKTEQIFYAMFLIVIALNYFAYNFIKIHRTLRMSPAMAAGVTDRLWSVEDLVALWEAYEQRRAERAA